jgi:hypothetical protein
LAQGVLVHCNEYGGMLNRFSSVILQAVRVSGAFRTSENPSSFSSNETQPDYGGAGLQAPDQIGRGFRGHVNHRIQKFI